MASFWVSSDLQPGSGAGTGNFLRVDVVDAISGNVLLPGAVGPIGDLGTGWTQFQVDLSPYVGMMIKLRFEAEEAKRAATKRGGRKLLTDFSKSRKAELFDGSDTEESADQKMKRLFKPRKKRSAK